MRQWTPPPCPARCTQNPGRTRPGKSRAAQRLLSRGGVQRLNSPLSRSQLLPGSTPEVATGPRRRFYDVAPSCCWKSAPRAHPTQPASPATRSPEAAYLWPLEPDALLPFSTAARYFPVYELGSFAIVSGVPAPTT